MTIRNGVTIVLIILLQFLTACDMSQQKKSSKITVEVKPNTTTLYYSGTIQPIQNYAVNNLQTEGYILRKNFEYGDTVQKNQLLFVITSQQVGKDYQNAFSDYIKAKKSYADAQYQMRGATELKKLKILSEQDYQSAKTQSINADLALTQATLQLQTILKELGLATTTLSQLDSTDPSVINAMLANAPNSVKIIAPASGIALLPVSSEKETQTSLEIGSAVKQGQNLLMIGDMSGISISINVTELYVEKILKGQTATITFDAFPGMSLKGVVSHVDRQANTDNNGGIPTFRVVIVVSKLTEKQLAKMRVGMSANAALTITTSEVIKLPLEAVFVEQGRSMVKKIDKISGKISNTPVETGNTDFDSVVITQGLNAGDEVLSHATSH